MLQSICRIIHFMSQWPFQNLSHPRIRLDFILVSEAVLQAAETTDAQSREQRRVLSATSHNNDSQYSQDSVKQAKVLLSNSHRGLGEATEMKVGGSSSFSASVERNNITALLSDHFPVTVVWEDSNLSGDILLYRRH